MKKYLLSVILASFSLAAIAATTKEEHSNVLVQTNMGDITIELDREHAPKTVENFEKYISKGFFDGTIFHRVIPNFMIQGGGFTEDLKQKAVDAPIQNEANNGLKNKRGTIAMARTSDPHSATAQFFINTVDNEFLNHTAPTGSGWGYTVFGKVTAGMDVVDAISKVPTGSSGMFSSDVPKNPIVIKKITLITDSK